ncbi:MAG: MFS transporter, partial [Kordiimonadaceae bacterium]|nr:MFS transporter [Kordiimonadaceae bacterium]
MNGAKHAHDVQRTPWHIVFLYSLPAVALSFPLIPFAVYLPVYYADDLGLGFAAVAAALGLSRLIDVLSDPIAGYCSDRWNLPLGRRKPWMIIGALLAGFALFKIANPPLGAAGAYLGIWAAALYIGWTFVMVPYYALGADLAGSYEENTRLVSAREGFGLIGILAAVSIPFFVTGPVMPAMPIYVLPFG